MDPVTLAALGFCGVQIASIIALHAGRVVVPRVGEWTAPPPVLVYQGGAVALGDVGKAMKTLQDLGHVFGALSWTSTAEVVPGAIVIGPPSQEQASANALASASWSTAFDSDELGSLDPVPLQTEARQVLGPIVGGAIRHAYIGLDALQIEGRDVCRIVAHELAHSLGFLHEETALFGRRKVDEDGKKVKGRARLGVVGRKTGHLMHPIYERGGWSTAGLEVEALDSERMFLRRRGIRSSR